jgi:hypothetical protein
MLTAPCDGSGTIGQLGNQHSCNTRPVAATRSGAAAPVKRFGQQHGQRSAAAAKPSEEVEPMQRYQRAATAGEAPVI